MLISNSPRSLYVAYNRQYQFLKTISQQDPTNIVIGTVRSTAETEEKVTADGLNNVHIVHGDMGSHTSLAATARAVAEITGGAVDYLIVNGCHVSIEAHMKSVDEWVGQEESFLEELMQSMHTNVAGTMFALNAFMPLVLKSKIKRVAAISSAGMVRDFIFEAEDLCAIPYTTAKAAINVLVAKFAARYKHEGVIFVALAPGYVNTHPEVPEELGKQVFGALYRWDETLKGPMPPEKSVEICYRLFASLVPGSALDCLCGTRRGR